VGLIALAGVVWGKRRHILGGRDSKVLPPGLVVGLGVRHVSK